MAFHELSPHERVQAVHVDMMRNKDFCILAGVTQIGNVHVDDTHPTAATDGEHVWYGTAFLLKQNRKQLRYLVAHENFHKAMHHCTMYKDLSRKYPREAAMAADYVVNIAIEDMDSTQFVERPTAIPPLIDVKYRDRSFLEVLSMLLKNPPPPQPKGGGGQGGQGETMDEHVQNETDGEGGEAHAKKVEAAIQSAVVQGEIMQAQLRGTEAGGRALSGFMERRTDWRGPLRRFIQEVCEGDEMSRYNPPNRRLLPLDILMPSHFSEATGEIIIAADTSGSMGRIYPALFGEIAQVCKTATPSLVRVLWWDTKVHNEQTFTAKDYEAIGKLLKPEGGGGTTASCVAQYIQKQGYKPKAVIMCTDGYIEAAPQCFTGNLLWGVFGNERFTPPRGKVLHLEFV